MSGEPINHLQCCDIEECFNEDVGSKHLHNSLHYKEL